MRTWQPNLKFDHVFVIVRIDTYDNLDVPLETRIMVVKIVWSEETAENEVERLNQLNGDKGAHYFWQVARLERSVGST